MTQEEIKLVASCTQMLTEVVNELQEVRYTCENPQRIGAIREMTRDIRGMLSTLQMPKHRSVIKSIRKIS
jgi:hypothetical protein